MRILVLGASGRTGRLVTQMAVARSHTVTALVRSADSFGERRSVRVVVGDPASTADITLVLKDQDAVISCLGQRSRGDAMLLRTTAAATVEAMHANTVRRYIVVSQGLLFPSRNPIVTLLRFILARHIADSTAMEKIVQASDLEWTIVRPPRLLEGGSPHGNRICVGAQPVGPWSMQRLDLAAYLLDEAEHSEHIRTIVGVTSG